MTELKTPPFDTERIEATDEFISKNNFKLRSKEEVIEKIRKVNSENNFLDFRTDVLLEYLDFESAKEFYKEEYAEKVNSGEIKHEYVTDLKECAQDFLDYMGFAWMKAQDERGISASRSIQKLGAWLWLMNREDLEKTINDDDLYNPYGAPALIEVCKQLGIEVPKSLVEFSKNKC